MALLQKNSIKDKFSYDIINLYLKCKHKIKMKWVKIYLYVLTYVK